MALQSMAAFYWYYFKSNGDIYTLVHIGICLWIYLHKSSYQGLPISAKSLITPSPMDLFENPTMHRTIRTGGHPMAIFAYTSYTSYDQLFITQNYKRVLRAYQRLRAQ